LIKEVQEVVAGVTVGMMEMKHEFKELGWTSLPDLVGLVGMVVDVSMRSFTIGSLYDYMYGSNLGYDAMISQWSKIQVTYFWTFQDE
jgi:hypothetical protein